MEPIEKLYVEASTLCNLNCTMCMRRGWKNEPMGHMDMGLYNKLIGEIKELDSIHTIFFGGIGEPMFHPEFTRMVRLAKGTGKQVECVTNGTLMTPDVAEDILKAGLDMAWFSVDGFDTATYEGIREHSNFAEIKRNILHITRLKSQPQYAHFRIGLTFVAMRSNVHQLMDLMLFANQVGASDVKISNVLPYDEQNMEQALYWRTLKSNMFGHFNPTPDPDGRKGRVVLTTNVDFPFMDLTEQTIQPLMHMLNTGYDFSMMGMPLLRKQGYCRFVQENNAFVKWTGEVAPCMGLLHPSETFLHGKQREIRPKSFGNIADQTITQIWESEEYAAFRDRVRRFDFSPCMWCGGCHRIESNQEDCYGNEHPTCGACLWAQGFIQCP